jgi:hypothetical protein
VDVKNTVCPTSGVTGVKRNAATVGSGIVDVVEVDVEVEVVLVEVDVVVVVVSVIFTPPGPTGVSCWHPSMSATANGAASSSFRMATWSS